MQAVLKAAEQEDRCADEDLYRTYTQYRKSE